MRKSYTFLRPETGQTENVSPEAWQWVVEYMDGTILKQFDDEGVFHQFKEINQEKPFIFKMISPTQAHYYTLLIDPAKMKLFHFYRNFVLQAGTPMEYREKIYCFGYEEAGQKMYFIINKDECIMCHDINSIHFY